MNERNKLTLVLYPNTNGIGYVICESPSDIIDFGIKNISRRTHKEYFSKIRWLIDYASPNVVILLDYNNAQHPLSKRQEMVIDEIYEYCKDFKLKVYKYSRTQIKDAFVEFKAFNKYEIAMTLIKWYPQLKSKEPYKRGTFLCEHYQMGVFDAFALMITHYYLS